MFINSQLSTIESWNLKPNADPKTDEQFFSMYNNFLSLQINYNRNQNMI